MLSVRLSSPAFLALMTLSALSSSCFFKRTPRAFNPPPPQTQPQMPAAAPPIAAEPPKIAGNPDETIPVAPATIPEVAAPPTPKPPSRRPVASAPKPAATPPPTESAPPPRLGQIFTADEQRQYNRTIEESLDRVRRALVVISRKTLNAEQTEIASRITTFQKQAEQARDAQDLPTAATLAQRADLLAQDLLGRIP